LLGLLLGLGGVLWIVVRAVRVVRVVVRVIVRVVVRAVVRVFKAVTLNRGFNVIVYVLSLGFSVVWVSARVFGSGSG
jgi:hypothetical protein